MLCQHIESLLRMDENSTELYIVRVRVIFPEILYGAQKIDVTLMTGAKCDGFAVRCPKDGCHRFQEAYDCT